MALSSQSWQSTREVGIDGTSHYIKVCDCYDEVSGLSASNQSSLFCLALQDANPQ